MNAIAIQQTGCISKDTIDERLRMCLDVSIYTKKFILFSKIDTTHTYIHTDCLWLKCMFCLCSWLFVLPAR
jgi:hypothetical protein